MNDHDEHPYNVIVKGEFTEQTIEWLEQNMSGLFNYTGWSDTTIVSFRDEIDAVTFKMKWG